MGGATEIVCNDSHGTMNNLNPADPHGLAAYVAGRHKPLYMEGMDPSVDAVKGVERAGTRTLRIEGDDPLAVYRSFVGITCVTRVAEGR
jgi:D-aminopeptidase